MPEPARIAVLASGGGSNLQAILDHFDSLGANAPGRVVLVTSNRDDAGSLDRARNRGIAAIVALSEATGRLHALLHEYKIDLIVLAGYLRMIPPEVIREYENRIVNVHPALLPKFGGKGMYGRHVHQAVIDAHERVSGVTVHLVTQEYDTGPILAQWPVAVLPTDDAESLAHRVLVAEHALYPRVVACLAAGDRARFPLKPPPRYFEHPPVTEAVIASDIRSAFENR